MPQAQVEQQLFNHASTPPQSYGQRLERAKGASL
jgi:hypothetical protein